MAHPELDQAFGRLAASRLGAGAAPGLAQPAAAEPCPDAETWAAYADGGLTPDEVAELDLHLSTCIACRQLVAALGAGAPVAEPAAALPAAGDRRGVLLPFRPRATWAWLSMAATLLAAITLWSVARFERAAQPESETATDRSAASPAPIAAEPPPPGPPAAPSPSGGSTPAAGLASTRPADGGRARATRSREEAAKALTDRLSRKNGRLDRAAPPAPAPAAATSHDQPLAATPAAAKPQPARPPELVNAQPGGRAVRGPAVNQQSQNQAARQAPAAQGNAAGNAAAAPLAAAAPPPPRVASTPPPSPPPPAPAPAEKGRDEEKRAGNERVEGQRAQGDAAKAEGAKAPPAEVARAAPAVVSKEADAKRAADTAAISESVTTTTGVAAGRQRDSARRKTAADAPAGATLGFAAGALRGGTTAFAEPEGRLRWRIADERRIESSSDGGATWNVRYPKAAERLRAGSAPSIDAAWVVGERGLVLRLTVPGGWTAVARPDTAATLTAVAATSADVARVTTDDGRVFVTTDGGRSWAPAPAEPPQ